VGSAGAANANAEEAPAAASPVTTERRLGRALA
jgi:hypothetical protein